MSDDKKVLFVVNGEQVDGLGRVNGQDAAAAPQAAELEATQARVKELEGDLQEAKRQIADLNRQLSEQGDPNSADTRTIADLKAALDAKGVTYDARANKAALQALAAENGV